MRRFLALSIRLSTFEDDHFGEKEGPSADMPADKIYANNKGADDALDAHHDFDDILASPCLSGVGGLVRRKECILRTNSG